jgi:hypothetical protein
MFHNNPSMFQLLVEQYGKFCKVLNLWFWVGCWIYAVHAICMGAPYKYYVPAESKEVSRGGGGESLAPSLPPQLAGCADRAIKCKIFEREECAQDAFLQNVNN